MKDELRADREIAQRLDRTWSAFFAQFGRLTPVQRAAIPAILAGRDVLICSATASGKTEAACAPLVERNIRQRIPWTILYISPTRALINDLFERLQPPLSRLGLCLRRRTGDHRVTLTQIPHILLTTPESFDSLLCRGRLEEPMGHVLAHVVAVVLDEVHLFYNSARGEQVRWLIYRLKRLRHQALIRGWAKSETVQIVALSATLADPQRVLQRFLPGGEVISVGGQRELEVVNMGDGLGSVEEVLPIYVDQLSKSEKILVFSNTRKRADQLAIRLKSPLQKHGYRVFVHHGKIAPRMRKLAEDTLKKEGRIVLIATSTLEIGIDIGDIDLIVLDGPAPDVPALLQRIGRGNRKTQCTRVLPCVGTAPRAEKWIHEAMLAAAREGWLGEIPAYPYHAVARQQVASYILQGPRRSRSRKKLDEFLSACAVPLVSRCLISHMISEGELVEDEAGLRLGEDWMEWAARGAIHSNINEPMGIDVVDERTGQVIVSGIDFRSGSRLEVAGNRYQVVGRDGRRLEVRPTSRASGDDSDWNYLSTGTLSRDGQALALRRYLGIPNDIWPVVTVGPFRYVFHLRGKRCQTMVEWLADWADKKRMIIRSNEFFILFTTDVMSKPEWLSTRLCSFMEAEIEDRLELLEGRLGIPAANRRLPLELRIDEVKARLQIDIEIARIQEAKWIEIWDRELGDRLMSLTDLDPA